jgi:secreted PhoX family phosphatase
MFINVQHPGDGDPAASSFPAARGSGAVPRDCTVVITKKNGGVIGS